MGKLDAFAAAQAAPHLVSGENIQWIACLMHPVAYNALGMPVRYDKFIGVATNMRLFAFEAVEDLFTLSQWGGVKAEVGKTLHVWWFNELGEVRQLPVHGLTSARSFYLEPFVSCGPLGGEGRRYCVMPGIDGFDAQNALGSPFVEWLQQGVAQRSFPIDPQKAAALAPHIQAWQVKKHHERLAAEKAQASNKKVAKVMKWVGGVAGWLVLLLICGGIYYSGSHDVSYWGKIVERDEEVRSYREDALAAVSKGKDPPTKCDYKGFDQWRCVCVDDKEHEHNSTTNAKRKLHPKLKLWCLDQDGLKSEIAGAATFDRKNEKSVADGRTKMMVGSFGGIAVFLIGLVLIVVFARRGAKAPPQGVPAQA